MALKRGLHSTAAYAVLDISRFHPADRQAIMEDAAMGGNDFGVRVVEEAVNGPARTMVYGVYLGGEDEAKWEKAKANLTDPDGAEAAEDADEAAIREAAAAGADQTAEAIRAAEDARVAEVTGDADKATTNKTKRA